MIHKRYTQLFLLVLLLCIFQIDFRARHTAEKNQLSFSDTSILSTTELLLPEKRLHWNRGGMGGVSLFRHKSIWNPSLTKVSDGYLMFFRMNQFFYDFPSINPLSWKRTRDYMEINGILLDEDLKPRSNDFKVEMRFSDGAPMNCPEDPKFIQFQDKLYCFFNHFYKIHEQPHNDMYVAEVVIEEQAAYCLPATRLAHPVNHHPQEKNWMPFVKEDRIFLVYNSSPFEILEMNPQTKRLSQVESIPSSLAWVDRFISGSTPCVEADGEYLTFFHSFELTKPFLWKFHKTRIYTFGAYTFSDNPYQIDKISPLPLGNADLYKAGFNKSKIVFPSDLIKKDAETIILAAGIGDHRIIFFEIDLLLLKEEMIPA